MLVQKSFNPWNFCKVSYFTWHLQYDLNCMRLKFFNNLFLKQLLGIDLQYCAISKVDPKIFKSNLQLRELTLANNEITALPGSYDQRS